MEPETTDKRKLLAGTALPESTSAQGAKPRRLLAGLVSESELCAELDIVPRTARKWRQTGEGPPFVSVGGAIYYPIDGFSKWLKSREQQPVREQRQVRRRAG